MKSNVIALLLCSSLLLSGCALLDFFDQILPNDPITPNPTITNSIPNPIPNSTSAYKATFDHQENRSNYKGCALVDTKFGLFASVYNNDTRKNCELMLNWNTIYKGGQETIGQGVEFNGKVYFPTEWSKGLVYDGVKAKETISLRHSSAVVNYKGTVCFVSSESDGEYLLNVETGARVLKLAVGAKVGIPFSAAKIPNSEEWIIVLADNAGNEVLVTTDGKVFHLAGAVSVENWGGTLIVGTDGITGPGGILYTIDIKGGTTKKYYDTGSKVVNHVWYDSENKLLWVSCCNPDRLLYITSFGMVHEVIKLTDDTTMKLFDTRITKGWWYRALGTRAQWYKIEKK